MVRAKRACLGERLTSSVPVRPQFTPLCPSVHTHSLSLYIFLHADKESLSEEVKAEMAIQIAGINRLMSGDPDYKTEDAYDVLCKVVEVLHIFNAQKANF